MPKRVVLGVLSLAATTITYAAESEFSPAYRESGPQFGVSIGQSTIKVRDESFGLGTVFDASDFGYKAFAGYRFNRFLAAEASYFWGGSPSEDLLGLGVATGRVKFEAATISGMLMWPLNPYVTVYGRGGYSDWHAKVTVAGGGESISATGNDHDLTWGAGISGFCEGALVRLEYEQTEMKDFGASAKSKYVSLGIAWLMN